MRRVHLYTCPLPVVIASFWWLPEGTRAPALCCGVYANDPRKGLYQAIILWGNMAHLVSERHGSRLLLLRGALIEALLFARIVRVTFPSSYCYPFQHQDWVPSYAPAPEVFSQRVPSGLTCYSSMQWPFPAEKDIYRTLIDRVVSNTLVGEWCMLRLVTLTFSLPRLSMMWISRYD